MITLFSRLKSSASAALLALGVALVPIPASAGDVLVFAAASLQGVLDEIATDWRRQTGHRVVVSYAGSSALARQIQQGAPADIFISASIDWMDAVEAAGEVRAGTRVDLLGNSLVLIAHGREAEPMDVAPGFDLAGRLGSERLAMAMVDAVPAGIYGKAALTALGIWDEIEPRVAQTDNVRAALALVATGEAPLGIVYATDAAVQDNVTIIGAFPAHSHDLIVYPAALLSTGASANAPAFLDYLRGDRARAVFEGEGFTVLD
jgi:molybdate transport system substrate-binding protein